MIFYEKHTPRWIVFGIDIAICVFSLILSYLLRFNFSIPPEEIDSFIVVFPFVLMSRGIGFYFFKTYAGIVRYTSTRDARQILLSAGASSFFFAALNPLSYAVRETFIVPYSIIIIDFITSVFMLTAYRLSLKMIYLEYKNPMRPKRNVIIYGAGEAGIITKRTLDRDAGTKYKVLAFIEDDPGKQGKQVEGVTIYSASRLEEFLRDNDVAHLILSSVTITPQKKQEAADLCLSYSTKILNVPPPESWINGELSFKQIKKIKIEELLERDPIRLDTAAIKKQIEGRCILITGAAGSIGSEIVRQIIPYSPSKIVLLDIAESPLCDMELDVREKFHVKNVEAVIGDIRNRDRMKRVFEVFRPQIVYHAAAYKHVPMMEENPSEALYTNVHGTKTIADLSVEYGVQHFVMISTDKAVNPTSVMGASKRIAEIYTQSLNREASTHFITTRFGNVLGSNGSVIPRFRKQIEEGGPVTITHPEINRYFMTIPEACQLVLEAGAMGKGGEIFIFDMGQSVKITDLAKKMIKLSGLTLGKDIQIVYTGLRPGEKLYEELLSDHENTIPTHHPKIMIAKVKEYDFKIVSDHISELLSLFGGQNNEVIVAKMKEIVPEFRSNNSVFEKLDAGNDLKK